MQMFFNIFSCRHNTASTSFQTEPSSVSCVSLCSDDKIGSLIFRAEQMLNSSSFALCEPVKELNSSGDTEDALDADRSWDNPPVTLWVMDNHDIFTLNLKKLLLFIGKNVSLVLKSNAEVMDWFSGNAWMNAV